MVNTDFSKYLTAYLSRYLPGQRNVSENTIKSYRDTFRLFLTFCKETKGIKPEKLTMDMINSLLINEFLEWIENERKCSISTRNQRLAGIHAFIRYVQIETPENLLSYQKILHMPPKKGMHKPMSYLTPEALAAILSEPDRNTSKGRRDLLLLTLLYDSGARVQELINLRVRDVRVEKPATVTIIGKGRKVRCIPLMTKTRSMVESYLQEHSLWQHAEKLDCLVFVNSRGEKLTRAGISYIINKYVLKAKEHSQILFPENISPHVFRHSKAMHMLQANINLIYIRDFLGHSNVTTTEVYAKADANAKRQALEKAYNPVIHDDFPDWTEDKNLMDWLQTICK
jgi:site-specific recombinase XerD